MTSTKPNADYSSLVQVREDIDRIDRLIVSLLGQRTQCVKAAAQFKKSEQEVAAPLRVMAMIAMRRQWAESIGVDADLVEELFRNMVSRFIQAEQKEWALGAGLATARNELP